MSADSEQIAELYKEIMLWCKAERKSKTALTIRQLATELDKTENYVSSIESGREIPSLKTFLEYLLILGFDVAPLKSLKITEDSLQTKTSSQRKELLEKIYTLDEDQVEYLVEQSRVAEDFSMKLKKKSTP